MDAERLWKEFTALPPDEQRQFLDFLAFLHSQHGTTADQVAPQKIALVTSPFVGMWRDRDDMNTNGRGLLVASRLAAADDDPEMQAELLHAAQSTLDFWDNSHDDEHWNEGRAKYGPSENEERG